MADERDQASAGVLEALSRFRTGVPLLDIPLQFATSRLGTGYAGDVGGLLRHPGVIEGAETLAPGLGGPLYQAGAAMEEGVGSIERGRGAREEAEAKARAERVRAAMGSAAPPPKQAARPAPGGPPPTSDAPQVPPGSAETVGPEKPAEPSWVRASVPGGGPSMDASSAMSRFVDAPAVKEALRARETPANRAGPFAIRAGEGGYSLSAQVPSTAGMSPEEFMEARAGVSPGVGRLMDERMEELNALRAQAGAIDQQQAQTGALEADAELRRAQAGAAGRESQTIPEKLGEQGQAMDEMMAKALSTPQADMLVSQMMAEWARQNPEAPEGSPLYQRQMAAVQYQVAMMVMPQLRDMMQSLDPEYTYGVMRGTGMLPGGGV